MISNNQTAGTKRLPTTNLVYAKSVCSLIQNGYLERMKQFGLDHLIILLEDARLPEKLVPKDDHV